MTITFDVLVDARALQDPDYAGRGIGRLTANLLAHAHAAQPALATARVIGIVDPLLPPLADMHRDLFDGLRTSAYTGRLQRPTLFIEPSPMTHDPLFVARLLTHPAIVTAAVVYDFIPWREPERYFRSAGIRLAYHTALAWLGRYRRLFAISAATATDLVALLRLSVEQVAVIGAPLDPAFEKAPEGRPRSPRHVLVAGGGDPRKNVECALRAHAASGLLRHSGVPLLVTGHYSRAAISALATMYAMAGGEERLLRFVEHIPDDELAGLYRDALAVVCPSRAEGFSLPVIEAMAAGAPVLASTIPVHAELIEDPTLLFAPDDDAALRRLLERIHLEPEFADGISANQAPIWSRFRAIEVARRFWAAIVPLPAHARAPNIIRGRRARLALLSPLPPDRSGCADYTAAVCADLGRLVELHLFTATANPKPIAGAASIRPLSALPLASSAFDRVAGVMGNSEFHLEIFRLLLRYGGACISHDARMLGFYRNLLGMERAQRVAAAELGRAVEAAEIERWLADESTLPTLFLSELAAGCEPVIFHSPITARLAADHYRIAERFLPFAIYRPWRPESLADAARFAARERLGIAREEIVLATFGYVDAPKCPEECIWALEMLRGWGIPARLYFVGRSWGEPTGLRALARALGLERAVCFLDQYASEATYRDFLLAADIGIQLRAFGFGAVSGALSDCIAAGLPAIANAELAESMQAPGFVRRIPDSISPVLLANEAADLIESGAHTRRLTPERDAYVATHSASAYADEVCRILGIERLRAAA